MKEDTRKNPPIIEERLFECDRCSRRFNSDVLWDVVIQPDTGVAKYFYVCLKCKRKLIKWLQGELNPPGYRRRE